MNRKPKKPRKLTPAERQRILELHRAGSTLAEVAHAVGRSVGAVHAAVSAAPAPARKSTERPAPDADELAADDDAAPTLEGLAVSLAKQLRDLEGDAERARAAGDAESLGRAQRHQVTTSLALARLTKGIPANNGLITMSKDDLDAAAQRAREAVLELVGRARAEIGGES